MKKLFLKKFFAAIIIPAVLCVSCSDDDNSVNYPTDPLSITIKADGTTSNGAKFAPASNNSFYLDYVLYQIVDSHLEVIGCDKSEIKGDVKIYSPINYLGVTYNVRKIEKRTFSHCEKVITVNLPDCIQEMGIEAFRGCTNLRSINLPSELAYIPNDCFNSCQNLTGITCPQNISYIGAGAFLKCNKLGNIALPNKITLIGEEAFYMCGDLGSIVIPASCEIIYYDAFAFCKFDIVKIESGVKKIRYRAFSYCEIDEVILPETESLIFESNTEHIRATSYEVFYKSNIYKVYAHLYHWTPTQRDVFFRGANIEKLFFSQSETEIQ